jgi:hypothetical protein
VMTHDLNNSATVDRARCPEFSHEFAKRRFSLQLADRHCRGHDYLLGMVADYCHLFATASNRTENLLVRHFPNLLSTFLSRLSVIALRCCRFLLVVSPGMKRVARLAIQIVAQAAALSMRATQMRATVTTSAGCFFAAGVSGCVLNVCNFGDFTLSSHRGEILRAITAKTKANTLALPNASPS